MSRIPIPHPKATKEQRRNVLTGTDMKRLVEGDWFGLWQEKTGARQSDDLTYVWKARLGLETEKLHAWWHGHVTGVDLYALEDRPHYMPHVDVPAHHAVTLDRWIPADDCPLEMKHTNARSSLRQAADYYMPQLQWQLWVMGCERLRFSVICGNEEPDWGYVARDEDYLKRLVRMADTFWGHVTDGIAPPPSAEPITELVEAAKAVPINGFKPYDFERNNAWVTKAARFLEIKPIADECETVKGELKDLVPADASIVTGGGLQFKRDKRGALRLTVLEEGS